MVYIWLLHCVDMFGYMLGYTGKVLLCDMLNYTLLRFYTFAHFFGIIGFQKNNEFDVRFKCEFLDELVDFEKAWDGNARKHLRGWTGHISGHNNMGKIVFMAWNVIFCVLR